MSISMSKIQITIKKLLELTTTKTNSNKKKHKAATIVIILLFRWINWHAFGPKDINY